MADALSQSQIDALLKDLNTGGEKAIQEIEEQQSERKVKAYDFRMPKKFTKEQIKILDGIYENYSRLLSSYLTGLLRLYCKVEVLQIEEQRYYEFNNALPDYVMMSIVDMGINDEDLAETAMIFQLSNPIVYTMMDRLMGGHGKYIDINRDFTEIEVGLMRGILNKMTELTKDAWISYIDLNPVLTSVETNSRVIQHIAPDDVVILIVLDIEIKDIKNTMSLCIPAMNLEAIMNHFGEKYSRNTRYDEKKEADRRNEIMTGLKDTILPVKAVLADTQIDLVDILHLQVDDVIPLNKNINSNIEIKIGETTWFDGKMGCKNNKMAIKIDKIYKN